MDGAINVPTAPEAPALGREFRLYITGQAVSLVGDRIALIALTFLVIHLSGSSAPALGVLFVAKLLPTLLGGLVVGVFVDHYSRRTMMIVCDLCRAALLFLVPSFAALTLWTVFPLTFALYALTLVFDTAARAALPDVVTEGQMLRANALLQGTEYTADLAYALGGALVYVLNVQVPFYVDAATFVFSALMVSAMRFPAVATGPLPQLRAVVTRIAEGVTYIRGNAFLRWTTVTFALAPLAGGGIFVLSPLYAARTLGASGGLYGPLQSGAIRFSLLEVGIGLGAVAGAALAARLGGRWPRGRVFGAGITGLGVVTILFAATSNFYLAVAFMALSGLCNGLFAVTGLTLLQTLTPSEMRGRVVAARVSVINGALAAGSAIAGLLLAAVALRPAWVVLGSIILLSSVFAWGHPEVRNQP